MPVAAEPFEDLAETAPAIDQAQDLRPVAAGIDGQRDARMLVLQQKRLTTATAEYPRGGFAIEWLMKEERDVLGMAIRRGAGRTGGRVEHVHRDAATEQLGHGILPPARQLAQRAQDVWRFCAQHHVRQIRRAAALHVGELQMQAVAVPIGVPRQPVEQFIYGIGAVLRMQQQVDQAGVALPVVVVEIFCTPEPVAGRQAVQDLPGVGDLACQVGFAVVDHAQQFLHLVDAGAAGSRIQHQGDRAIGLENGAQRLQTGIRIGQVMQHATAIDVVERLQRQAGQVEQ
ncbi:MAG: hypothetical protein CAPSK01_001042 [Candidatus Accumulibacter vicinus]|uniref:Uncharacterized protein n=1 Tax=Candidatus Accumulibacter vicinus TaxID=2954382 RepID=A0A084Y3K2_9PROT|nr:MAG: hypothetical protein CAPSK01_001042 [Candidatus Accumulibacter vicinus]